MKAKNAKMVKEIVNETIESIKRWSDDSITNKYSIERRIEMLNSFKTRAHDCLFSLYYYGQINQKQQETAINQVLDVYFDHKWALEKRLPVTV